MIFIWLIVAVCFLIFEMGHPGLFYCLSFFFGALTAAASSIMITSSSVQIAVFFLGSIIACMILKRWIKKEEHIQYKTNVYALQGKTGLVIYDITVAGTGAIKVGGEIWSAKELHGKPLFKGSVVEVVRVQGSHLIVKEHS